MTCRPDASCLLLVQGIGTRTIYPLVLYAEADNSTESQTQVEGKLPGYFQLGQHAGYRRHWTNLEGHRVHFRVLFVCQTKDRVRELLTYWSDHPASPLTGGERRPLSPAALDQARQFLRTTVWATTHEVMAVESPLTGCCWYRLGDDPDAPGSPLLK